jgi:hypothetical protein
VDCFHEVIFLHVIGLADWGKAIACGVVGLWNAVCYGKLGAD